MMAVKIETAEKIARGVNQAAMDASGGADIETSMSELTRFLSWLIEMSEQFRSYENIRDTLLKMEEPSRGDLLLIMGSLRLGPGLLKTWAKSEAKKFVLEQRGAAGHPQSIPTDRYRAICLEVSACELDG